MRLRILLAVIGTLFRCSAWMPASIVSIFHFGITWLVMIASHRAAHVSQHPPSGEVADKDTYCMAFALAVRRLRGTPIPSTPEIYVLDRVLSRRNDPGGCFDLETLQVGGNKSHFLQLRGMPVHAPPAGEGELQMRLVNPSQPTNSLCGSLVANFQYPCVDARNSVQADSEPVRYSAARWRPASVAHRRATPRLSCR